MKRFLNPFVLVLAAILGLGYFYITTRIGAYWIIVPVFLVWAVPVFYWSRRGEQHNTWDDVIHALSYVSMGWLNFLLVCTIGRDLILLVSSWDAGANTVLGASIAALLFGLFSALRGPKTVHIDIPIAGLDPALEGLRIAQISDLHVSPMIRRRYVQKMVDQTNALKPDLVVLTGDLVDGTVERLADFIAPLAELEPKGHAYLILGNHEYYSGIKTWIPHFRQLGLDVLLNEYRSLNHQGATFHLGGVLDQADLATGGKDGPRPDLAIGPAGALRILLAHNPKLAAASAAQGFDLMLSGHTHAGQFFPWNIAVRLVHAPHVMGLSREGSMQVYVNPGTGSWGPPIRLGTQTELTLIRLVRALQ